MMHYAGDRVYHKSDSHGTLPLRIQNWTERFNIIYALRKIKLQQKNQFNIFGKLIITNCLLEEGFVDVCDDLSLCSSSSDIFW